MPIYEYQCDQCGNVTEAFQKFSDPPMTTCQRCSGPMHKLISASSFHLKGSGWYVTDYAGKKATGTPSADAKAPASTGGGETGASTPESKSSAD
jgi:putative FmdB family regulatory protein